MGRERGRGMGVGRGEKMRDVVAWVKIRWGRKGTWVLEKRDGRGGEVKWVLG